MKTLCLDSGVPLEWSTCLSCALSGQQPCGWDYGLLRAVRDHQARERTGIHVSDVKACLLKAYWGKTRGHPPDYPSRFMAVVLGTLTHNLLDRSDHALWTELPVSIAVDRTVLYGTVDAYHVALGRIVDYKTTRYLSKDKLPYGDHEDQVRIYALMLRKMGLAVHSAAIQYIDLSGPPRCRTCKTGQLTPGPDCFVCEQCGREWEVRASAIHSGAVLVDVGLEGLDTLEAHVAERVGLLSRALKDGATPPGEPSWACNYCPFRKECLNVHVTTGG